MGQSANNWINLLVMALLVGAVLALIYVAARRTRRAGGGGTSPAAGPLDLPELTNARVAKAYEVGRYLCVVLTDCQTAAERQFAHLMFVHHGYDEHPALAVAAEVKPAGSEGGWGPHQLALYSRDGRQSLGSSADWSKLEPFIDRALQVVAETTGTSAKPKEVSIPKPKRRRR